MELNTSAEGKNFVCIGDWGLCLHPYYHPHVDSETIQQLIDEATKKGFTYTGHIILQDGSYGCGNGFATGALFFLEMAGEKFVGGCMIESWFSCEDREDDDDSSEDREDRESDLEILHQSKFDQLEINGTFKDEIAYVMKNMVK